MKIEIKSKDELELLLDYFSTPPNRLLPNYNEIEEEMREACKEFGIEIPYWLKGE